MGMSGDFFYMVMLNALKLAISLNILMNNKDASMCRGLQGCERFWAGSSGQFLYLSRHSMGLYIPEFRSWLLLMDCAGLFQNLVSFISKIVLMTGLCLRMTFHEWRW